MKFQPIPGHRGYSASREGYIRNDTTGHETLGGISNQYRRVAVKRSGVDVTYLAYTHDLIARTYLGPKPKGHVVCHGAGGSTDCSVTNLRYDTQSSNIKEMWDNGGRDGDK